ncbi:Uncharacterised protein [Niallia circulans]|nr:Uncharacterised protein [Niallia circulans]
MKQVVLLNRTQLEQELERQGILDVLEQLIERMKEHVQYTSKQVFEQVIIDAKVLVDNAVKTIVARFAVLPAEDPAEDGEAEETKYVEFESLSRVQREV